MRVLERIAILAPAIVIAVGLLAGIVILLGRAASQSVRSHPHPHRIVAVGVGAVAVLVALSLLGVRLPHE